MSNLIKTLILSCLFITNLATAKNYSIDEAVSLAKKNNELMAIAKSEFEKTKTQVREAWSTILPQVDVKAQYQRFLQNPVFFTSTFPIKNQFESSVNVSQLIYAFGKVGGAIKAAKVGKKIGGLQTEITEAEVAYLVQTSYFTALFYKEQLKIAQQSLNNAIENLGILQKKYSSGRPPKGDLLRLRSDVETRKTQVKTQESSYKQSLLALSRIIGVEDNENLGLANDFYSSLPDLKKESIKSQFSGSTKRLDALKETAELRKISAKIEGAGRYPTLAAFGSFIYSGGSTENSIDANDLNDYSLVGLQLQWNLWSGGSTSAKYNRALHESALAQIDYQKGQRDLRLNIDQYLVNYHSLIDSKSSSTSAVKLAEESFRITQRRFRTGQASVTELNSVESALTQTKMQLANNIFQIHMTIAELENLLMISPGGLK